MQEFITEAFLEKNDRLDIKFDAGKWNRCNEHHPAAELIQLILALPSNFDG